MADNVIGSYGQAIIQNAPIIPAQYPTPPQYPKPGQYNVAKAKYKKRNK